VAFFVADGPTNEFSQFKFDSICFPMFSHYDSLVSDRVHHHMPDSVVLTGR